VQQLPQQIVEALMARRWRVVVYSRILSIVVRQYNVC